MVDPATASGKSNMAIMSFVFCNGVLVIVGMEDCFTWRTSEIEAQHLLVAHVRGLKSAYGALMQDIQLVPMIEMNNNSSHSNGLCAALVNARIATVHDVFHQTHRSDYIPYAMGGVHTTAGNKTDGYAEVSLRMCSGTYRLAENLFCTGITEYKVPPMPTPEMQAHWQANGAPPQPPPIPVICADGAARAIATLQEQLPNMAEDAKGGISGKGTSKLSVRRDDLGIVFILGPFFAVLARKIHMGVFRY
jgi:hypothetical protein